MQELRSIVINCAAILVALLTSACAHTQAAKHHRNEGIRVTAIVEAYIASYPYIPSRGPYETSVNRARIVSAAILTIVDPPPNTPVQIIVFLDDEDAYHQLLSTPKTKVTFTIDRTLLRDAEYTGHGIKKEPFIFAPALYRLETTK